MDKIAREIFESPTLYGRAIELLDRYKLVSNENFEIFDTFLSELDELEEDLLDKAICYEERTREHAIAESIAHQNNHSPTPQQSSNQTPSDTHPDFEY